MVGRYFASIWSDMMARMSGLASLVFTVLGVYSQYFIGTGGLSHARYFFWVAAGVCFVFANYRVWADEHRKVISGQPHFTMTIENLRYEYLERSDQTLFIFAVGIVNKGAASITSGWQARYLIAGNSVPMNITYLVDQWVLRMGKEAVTLRPEDQITSKTINHRVETGDGKQGRIFFWLRGDHIAEIRSLQYQVEIEFHDFLGRPWSRTYIPSPNPVTSIGMYPGERGEILSDTSVPELSSSSESSEENRAKTIDND